MKCLFKVALLSCLTYLTVGCSNYGTPLSPAELWAYTRITTGWPADLQDYSDDPNQRVLREGAVKRIIIDMKNEGDVRLAQTRDITIRNALVKGDLILRFEHIKNAIFFTDCRFEGIFYAEEATFDRSVFLIRNSFKGVVFNSAKFSQSLIITEANFTDPNSFLSLNGTIIKGNLNLSKIECAGSVNLVGAECGGQFQMEDAEFTNPDSNVSFARMSVDDAAILSGTKFAGHYVNLGMKKVGGFLDASRLECTNKEGLVDFGSLSVEEGANFSDSNFWGTVSFIGAKFNNDLNLLNTRFMGKYASFQRIQVSGTLNVGGAIFGGAVNFDGADVGEFGGLFTKFENAEKVASFYGMIVRNDLVLFGSTFHGETLFHDIHVGGDMQINDSNFLDGNSKAFFTNVTVGGSASFRRSRFKGGLVFSSSRVGRNMVLSKADFGSEGGTINLRDLEVGGALMIDGVQWSEPIHLFGMSYDRIEGDGNNLAERAGLGLVRRADFTLGTYTTLENCLREKGYVKEADEVYIEMMQTLRKRNLSGFEWFKNFVLDWTVVYGRRPHHILIPIICLVILGAFVFKRDLMKPIPGKNNDLKYNPWGYSIDLFLPVINMRWKKQWIPNHGFLRFWMCVHMLVGWFSITIFLAALAGLIR